MKHFRYLLHVTIHKTKLKFLIKIQTIQTIIINYYIYFFIINCYIYKTIVKKLLYLIIYKGNLHLHTFSELCQSKKFAHNLLLGDTMYLQGVK